MRLANFLLILGLSLSTATYSQDMVSRDANFLIYISPMTTDAQFESFTESLSTENAEIVFSDIRRNPNGVLVSFKAHMDYSCGGEDLHFESTLTKLDQPRPTIGLLLVGDYCQYGLMTCPVDKTKQMTEFFFKKSPARQIFFTDQSGTPIIENSERLELERIEKLMRDNVKY